MKLTFLGTGTSTGVPQLLCNCATCQSTDSRDKRMRCSALIEHCGKNLLIDCGPDFRRQMLLYHRNKPLDALLVTHHHYDHVGGTDDLRPYCRNNNAFPIYCNKDVANDLHRRMPYCFTEHPYPGVPRLDVHTIEPMNRFNVCGIEVEALPIMHYKLEILGFRIGKLAYITDAKEIPEQTLRRLEGIDTLIINALRIKEHMSHLNLQQALQLIDRISPRVSYLTHISHDMPQTALLQPTLPTGVFPANDGATISIPD